LHVFSPKNIFGRAPKISDMVYKTLPKPVSSWVEKGRGLGVGLVTSPCKTIHTTETARGNNSGIQTRQERKSLPPDDAEGGSITDVDQSREEVFISKRRIFNGKSITKIGTWNVCTLYQCGSIWPKC